MGNTIRDTGNVRGVDLMGYALCEQDTRRRLVRRRHRRVAAERLARRCCILAAGVVLVQALFWAAVLYRPVAVGLVVAGVVLVDLWLLLRCARVMRGG